MLHGELKKPTKAMKAQTPRTFTAMLLNVESSPANWCRTWILMPFYLLLESGDIWRKRVHILASNLAEKTHLSVKYILKFFQQVQSVPVTRFLPILKYYILANFWWILMRFGTNQELPDLLWHTKSHLDQKRNDRDMGLGPFHRAEGVLQMGFQKWTFLRLEATVFDLESWFLDML